MRVNLDGFWDGPFGPYYVATSGRVYSLTSRGPVRVSRVPEFSERIGDAQVDAEAYEVGAEVERSDARVRGESC